MSISPKKIKLKLGALPYIPLTCPIKFVSKVVRHSSLGWYMLQTANQSGVWWGTSPALLPSVEEPSKSTTIIHEQPFLLKLTIPGHHPKILRLFRHDIEDNLDKTRNMKQCNSYIKCNCLYSESLEGKVGYVKRGIQGLNECVVGWVWADKCWWSILWEIRPVVKIDESVTLIWILLTVTYQLIDSKSALC